MYKLSINTGGTVWAFLYKEKDAADEHASEITLAMRTAKTDSFSQISSLHVTDDYGQSATITLASISGILLEDLDLTQEAMIKLHLHNQHTQIKAQQRVNSDATIKAAQIGNGGGVMFDPMAGRRFSQ